MLEFPQGRVREKVLMQLNDGRLFQVPAAPVDPLTDQANSSLGRLLLLISTRKDGVWIGFRISCKSWEAPMMADHRVGMFLHL